MVKGGRGQTKQLHDLNWGTFDHTSRAPQLLRSSNYCNHIVILSLYKSSIE